jgi:hypothetical protein
VDNPKNFEEAMKDLIEILPWPYKKKDIKRVCKIGFIYGVELGKRQMLDSLHQDDRNNWV